jgi:MFS family permease
MSPEAPPQKALYSTLGFLSSGQAREYLLIAIATFLVFLTHSKLAFLSVILRDIGLPDARIGVVLSAPLMPVLLGIYVSGHLMDRFGPLRVVRGGFFLMLAAYTSLQLTVLNFPDVIVSRAIHGFGYGIFMPAGMVYVKGKLRPDRMVYMFGVYGSMLILPNILGPGLMEFFYDNFGMVNIFVYTAVPMVAGNMLMIFARAEPGGLLRADPGGYFSLLRVKEIRLPVIIIFIVGSVYGFVVTLMALFLKLGAVPVARFFIPFTLALFLSRLLVMPMLSKVPRKIPVLSGFLLMGISYLLIWQIRTTAVTILTGILFGIGYSLEYPNISVWIAERFRQEDRGKPVAFMNMVFHTGIFLTPLIGGWIMDLFSLDIVILSLAFLSLAAAAMLVFVKVPNAPT